MTPRNCSRSRPTRSSPPLGVKLKDCLISRGESSHSSSSAFKATGSDIASWATPAASSASGVRTAGTTVSPTTSVSPLRFSNAPSTFAAVASTSRVYPSRDSTVSASEPERLT